MNTKSWLRHALRNRLQSLLMLLVMAGFMALLGGLLWGANGVQWLLWLTVFLVLMNPVVSPRMILRMYGATPVGPEQLPGLYQTLAILSRRAGLDQPPELYYVPSQVLNAFAVGNRRYAAIAVSDGLLRHLDRRELLGVLAHEVSHVQHNDMWVMGLADLFSRATSLLSTFGQFLLLINLPLILLSQVSISWGAILLLIFAPQFSALAQLALSRVREYDADLNAARLTGDPLGLASALAKLEQYAGGMMEQILLPGRRRREPSLLRTHPPTDERIRRLQSLAGSDRLSAHNADEFRDPLNRHDVQDAFVTPVQRQPRRHFNGLWH
ncbi:MAG TPA: peptidase M48 [Gammaproteobacteria bacterium]|nr:peptidase M48 [Gammaproteobacteria bacterium]